MKTLIFKLSKDSQPYEKEKKIANNYVFATKINTHTRSLNYTTVHIN